MKVVHVQLFPLLSGVQRVSLEEIRLLRNKISYSAVCRSEGEFTDELRNLDVEYHLVDHLRRDLDPINDLKALRTLFLLFRSQKFDVVHTHSSKTGILGRMAAKGAGCPLVVHTVHGFSFPFAKSYLQKAIFYLMEWIAKWFTDRLIVLNDSDYDIAVNKLGFSPNRITLLPNGIDTNIFTPDSSSNQFNPSHRDLRVVMVGRLDEQKDPYTFLNAALLLLQKNRNIRFDFIGGGREFDELSRRIEDSGFSSRISLLSWRNDVATLLRSYDIFVLPSRWEGMPLAILEAQSSGLPVVATNIPGNNDLVEDHIDGRLFNVGDAGALAEILDEYYHNPGHIQKHGVAARTKAVNEFDIVDRVESIATIYKNK